METITHNPDGLLLESQDPQSVLELTVTDINIIGMDTLCRLCANTSDRLIPIYSEEGTSNDLANKMNLYLPVKVSQNDNLPLQCCWHCATTVLAWHELIVACVEADRRLRSLEINAESQIIQSTQEDKSICQERTSDSTAASPSAFCPEPETPRKRTRNAKKKTNPVASIVIKEESSPKDNTVVADGSLQHYIEYIDNIRNPFMTDCDLIEENEDVDDVYDVEEDVVSDDDKLKTKQYGRATSKADKPLKQRSHVKMETVANVTEEDDKLLTEWISKTSEDKPELICFSCECCTFETISEADLMQHVKSDHADVLVTLKRPQKKKQSQTESLVKKERRKNNKLDQDAVNAAKITVDGRVYYHCKLCGKNLHSPYTYVWHNRIHTGERPFVCDLCGKQFRVSQGLVRHLRETHEGVKNFPCDICGRMFATRRNVEEHRRIHTNERPYICDLCGKSFKQKASLFVHNRSHNDSFPFKCMYCDQGFRTRPHLLVHITRHTGEKPYPCDICGRCFRIKYELKRHKLIHSDEKPFTCLDCNISFRQKRYLRNHNKINHNRSTD